MYNHEYQFYNEGHLPVFIIGLFDFFFVRFCWKRRFYRKHQSGKAAHCPPRSGTTGRTNAVYCAGCPK
jgi:hypothetical protein